MNERSKSTRCRSRSEFGSLDLSLVASYSFLNRLIKPSFHSASPLLVEVLKRNNYNLDAQNKVSDENKTKQYYRCCASPSCCLNQVYIMQQVFTWVVFGSHQKSNRNLRTPYSLRTSYLWSLTRVLSRNY